MILIDTYRHIYIHIYDFIYLYRYEGYTPFVIQYHHPYALKMSAPTKTKSSTNFNWKEIIIIIIQQIKQHNYCLVIVKCEMGDTKYDERQLLVGVQQLIGVVYVDEDGIKRYRRHRDADVTDDEVKIRTRSKLKKRKDTINSIDVMHGVRKVNLDQIDLQSHSMTPFGRVDELPEHKETIAQRYFKIPKNGKYGYDILLQEGYKYEFRMKMEKVPMTFFGDERKVTVKVWLKQRGKLFSQFSQNFQITDTCSTKRGTFKINASIANQHDDQNSKKCIQFLNDEDDKEWNYCRGDDKDLSNHSKQSESDSPTSLASESSNSRWKLSFSLISGSSYRTMHVSMHMVKISLS